MIFKPGLYIVIITLLVVLRFYRFEGGFDDVEDDEGENAMEVSKADLFPPEKIFRSSHNAFLHCYFSVCSKASELVPCSLLSNWNSMRFFATVALYD